MRLRKQKASVYRIALSVLVSVSFVFAPTPAAYGADILRTGRLGTGGEGSAAAAGGGSGVIIPPAVLPNAQDRLARTTQVLQAVKAMQDAARALAATGANNLGLDPNHPGVTLPNVLDGLAVGGLQVAPAVPADLLHPKTGEDASLWQGANLPTQTTTGGQTDVTVVQTAPQALLNWQTFNVGRNTTLDFDQSAGGSNVGEWIAFNKVSDPTAVPSQILGSIKAAGQIYVINQNGIIFGGSAQVNTHALVASALPVNDNLIGLGLLNNPDTQFLFSALPVAAGANGTPAFTPPASPLGTVTFDTAGKVVGNAVGDVTVQAGAQLTAPTSADHVGGKVALIGGNVVNQGTISTPDGQTILAAGSQVGFGAHSTSDPTLRGVDVYVGKVAAGGGAATNDGLIDAPRAAVTMVGKSVNQLGTIDSSTSVTLNGRIDLLADYDSVGTGGYSQIASFFPQSTGTVTLGTGSVTRILPELDSTERVVGTQLALPSLVDIVGRNIHLGTDATVLAPNANPAVTSAANGSLTYLSKDAVGHNLTNGVTLDAGSWIFGAGTGAQATDQFMHDQGQIYFDSGATIDVSGSQNVAASVSENIVSVQLLGSQLANSPVQRNGALRGQTVQVDVCQTGTYNGQAWAGTPLADTTGYVGLIQRSVGELSSTGGTVALSAGESVVMQSGSNVNVSGGWIDYAGSIVQTTQLLSNGHIFDISQATPDRVYDGIYTGTSTTTSSKWGVTQSSANPLPPGSHYEDGYIQGGSAGSISITAPSVALDGSFVGQTVAGAHQRTPSSQIASQFAGSSLQATELALLAVPTPGALSLTFQNEFAPEGANAGSIKIVHPTPPDLAFASTRLAPADPFALDSAGKAQPLRDDRKQHVVLSPDLMNSDGIESIAIDNRDGDITVPADVALSGAPGGSLSLTAANLYFNGQVTIPDGALSFNVYDSSLGVQQAASLPGAAAPSVDPARGHFMLGATARLNTAGLLVNDLGGTATAGSQPFATSGGSVSIKAFDANLLPGSSIDVSGGETIGATGKVSYGKGGSISIASGTDLDIPSLVGGGFELGSRMQGYSGGTGGSLSLTAPLIQVGGSQLLNGDTQGRTLWLNATNAAGQLLGPDFFSQGGFSSIGLTGQAGVEGGNHLPGLLIAPGTTIDPQVTSRLAQIDARGNLSFNDLVQPAGLRAPVNLRFGAIAIKDFGGNYLVPGSVVVGSGATIQTAPNAKSSITVSGDTVAVFGTLRAPGGKIDISGETAGVFGTNASSALATVDLGSQSILSVVGATVLTPDPRGYRTGQVLAGGSINVSGNIVAEPGSTLDVSGASDVLDLLPAYSQLNPLINTSTNGSLLVPTRIDSNGGTIILTGKQELISEATLRGAAGGPSATGGNLIVSSDIIANGNSAINPKLFVTQSDLALAHPTGADYIGQLVTDANGQPISIRDSSGNMLFGGFFAADDFNHSGLASLALKGNVMFSGSVSLAAARSLAVADGGVILSDKSVTSPSTISLTAPYVDLGQAFATPVQADQIHNPATSGVNFDPTYGPATFQVNASLIDVGTLSFQNIGAVNLIADHGDVRGDGIFDLAGDLYIRAGQIYPPSAVSFDIDVYDYTTPAGVAQPGTVKFVASGTRQLPLSAGGQLDVYASAISQGGVLRAPQGSINLGWSGSGTAPVDLVTGKSVAAAQTVTLVPGGEISVSGVDPTTGQALVVPYGVNLNGTAWIDPTGVDITNGGAPAKSVSIAANAIFGQSGASIDLNGGGDLFAYRFVSGVGGTNDVLASTGSFAVIPGYQADYAPYAPYNQNDNFGSDQGYVNGGLAVGDQVYLAASNGLPAGTYTLLPARYALLPGAFLVTPKSTTTPTGVTTAQPDGSSLVSGYRFNDLDATRTSQPINSTFEVASQAVVNARAEYDQFSGNSFLSASAVASNTAVPRLPVDAGQLVFGATSAMSFQSAVTSTAPTGGRGGLVDIDSAVDIVVGPHGGSSAPDTLFLDAQDLSGFGAQSLLIGGTRTAESGGSAVVATAGKVVVDNAGTPLTGSDVILVAKDRLTLAAGADIEATGAAGATVDSLVLGDAANPGSGNGALVRVSGDAAADVIRAGVDTSTTPALNVGAGVKLSGTSLTLDSTATANFDPKATLAGTAVSLAAGQVSVQLSNPGALQPGTGLVVSSGLLQSLQSAQSLSFSSYSSLDFYGTGEIGSAGLAKLSLHTPEIRGFNTGAGTVTLAAGTVLLDNRADTAALGPAAGAASTGTLAFSAGTLELGANALKIDQFAHTTIAASNGILAYSAGSVSSEGALAVQAAAITAAAGANETIAAGGNLALGSSGTTTSLVGGTGATLTFVGDSIDADTNITLPSGTLTLRATTGDVKVGDTAPTRLDVGGAAQDFYDVVRSTDGGRINLIADSGAVTVASDSTLNVGANVGGGNAGTLSIGAPGGSASLDGTLLGQAGAGGLGGTFAMDAGTVAGSDLTALNADLNSGGFTEARSFRVRTGDVSLGGLSTAHHFALSADQGSVTVSGEIDASGQTGGMIDLGAHGSVTLASGAVLDASGQQFSDAGKGGAVNLSAGAETDGEAGDASAQVAIQTGSTIDLSVAANVPASTVNAAANTAVPFPTATAGNDTVIATTTGTIVFTDGTTAVLAANTPTAVAGGASVKLDAAGSVTFAGSAAAGDFTGTLHLRAPQNSTGTDVQVAAIDGAVRNASSIVVEGYKVFDLTSSGGTISTTVENAVRDNGAAFAGGVDSHGVVQAGNTAAISARLLVNQGGASGTLGSLLAIEPGAELVNRTGDLTLPTSWDLSTYRFGPKADSAVLGSGAPGVLTLRAAGNVVFDAKASLSDGFGGSSTFGLWDQAMLPTGSQSWSYRIVAGADLTSADLLKVLPSTSGALGTGSVLLGYGAAPLPVTNSTSRQSIIPNYFQTIRTGTGDISIAAAGDVMLLNPLVTIYTAGTQAPTMANFDRPALDYVASIANVLGASQPPFYPAQFSFGGGNVSIAAQGDIAHGLANGGSAGYTADSSMELPTNWLYRRGYIDPTTGQFAATHAGGEVASTAWWIDFSNFFEGVGALGGGNVSLQAGGNISNVDAVVPTVARMPKGTPAASRLFETGGGDLSVTAGRDIDGGVYYVERGSGTLAAGGSIHTNSTRAALPEVNLLAFQVAGIVPDPSTWLPTTLFLGRGDFTIAASDDVLLGQVANPFLLPQGINNTYYDKTYFSTYGPNDRVGVTSLAGDVTIRGNPDGGQGGNQGVGVGSLAAWYQDVLLFDKNGFNLTAKEPWLKLVETTILPPSNGEGFTRVTSLFPPTLEVTALTGDINLVGSLTLSPAAKGTVGLVAAGAINGFQVNQVSNVQEAVSASNPLEWGTAVVDLSDADPNRIPSPASPVGLLGPAGGSNPTSFTPDTLLSGVNALFAETGATSGSDVVLQTKQALHASYLLHADDSTPVYLYAAGGDISGLTFYSPKSVRAVAAQDITDISLYAQNVSATDFSLVSAGRDLIAYDPSSTLRQTATAAGDGFVNVTVNSSVTPMPGSGQPAAGDLQIGGPGTLEVFAGRNLNLGVGPTNDNGTAVGLTSIGNTRNPYLPFGGADIVAGAGIGSSLGLDRSQLDFTAFIGKFLDPSTAGSTADLYLPSIGTELGLTNATREQIWDAYNQLPPERRDALALDIFYLVLRDAGRDHNLPDSPGFRNYDAGYAAIAALFPGKNGVGDISLTSREIKTTNGGDISVFAPNGELTVGFPVANQPVDQGILTAYGGNISIFTGKSVTVGTSRIFTLRGGNEVIWSTTGNIAAGASSKTVQSAPPTRVIVDPQSANVQTDLAGLATGGGIGVLESVAGVVPGDVDLIAPTGTIDAGDAGIRSSGKLNIAAVQVLNATNIQAGGAISGTPAPPAPPSLGSLTVASNTVGAAASTATTEAARQTRSAGQFEEVPSIITVEVLGYGGGDGSSSGDDKKKQEL